MAKTILVIDDDPGRRESVAEAMVLEGYRATTASSGEEALERLPEARADLVVLGPPGPTRGPEICRALRAASPAPIVLLAGDGTDADREAWLAAGVDDLVTGPFSLRELAARVGALLRRAQPMPAAGSDGFVDLGRVQADLRGRRLLEGDRAVPMRPRAFALLAFFIGNPGQVFTRDELLERVWGYDAGRGTRTVDVHVHWLRQRIEEDAAHPALLQTVRGIGYVFRRPP